VDYSFEFIVFLGGSTNKVDAASAWMLTEDKGSKSHCDPQQKIFDRT
jgi:hypothetical protein